jgi:hypothetical protein
LRQAKLKNKLFAKAFSWVRAGGSLNPGVSYGEAGGRAKALSLVSLPFTGETSKELRGVFGDGLYACLESRIHDLAGEGLRNVLKEYLRLWGVLC